MDHTIIVMPLDYQKYFDKPDYGGIAPPTSVLPMPRFFKRNYSLPQPCNTIYSSVGNESSSESPISKASSTTASVTRTTPASQDKVPLSDDETEDEGSEGGVPLSNDRTEIPETKLNSKAQIESQSVDQWLEAVNNPERRIPFQKSRLNRSWIWKAGHHRDKRSTRNLLCPLCLHPIQDPLVQEIRNQNLLYYLQGKLEVNIAKQRSLRIEASNTQPFKVVGSDGIRVYW